MAAVGLTLGLLVALLIALLAVPLTIVFSVHRVEAMRGVVQFRWLFGLVRLRVLLPRPGKARAPPSAAPKKKPKPPRRKKKKGRAGDVVSLIWQRDIRRRAHRFIRDVLRATNPQDLVLRLRIGLGDPADTGRLWALLGPVAGIARNLRSAAVHIEPEFVDPVFEVEGRGRFRLVPIRLIALTLAFLLSPAMLRVWPRIFRGDA